MMQEEFVTFETAKLLYDADFPLDGCESSYEEIIGLCGREYYPKPTQAQVIKWLRVKKAIIVEPRYQWDGAWRVIVVSEKFNLYKRFTNSYDNYPTYEAAAEEGIKAACKYLIEKNNNK